MAKASDTSTLCAHAGNPRTPDIGSGVRSHVSPLYPHSVFDFPSIEASKPALDGNGFVYRRCAAPNPQELADTVALLEGAEAGLATNSGMSAIAAAVLGTVGAGDSLVVQQDAYGGTSALLDQDLVRFGVTVKRADVYDIGAFTKAVGGARVALVETLSNPLLRECDVSALAKVCEETKTVLIVDNTFSTPLRDRPLHHGAHLVVHSVTKFLGGHHDLSAGAVVGSRELVAHCAGVATRLGLGAAPMDAWLAVRGIRTLELRMERSWQNADMIAAKLRQEASVLAVNTASRCALVSFDLGSEDDANWFVEGLDMITLSPSLGGVTTTVAHPATSSHKPLSVEARARAGIGDGLVRISCGIESSEAVWADIQHALHRKRL